MSVSCRAFMEKLSVMLFSDMKDNKGAVRSSSPGTTAHACKGSGEDSLTWALKNLNEEHRPSASSTRRPSTDLDSFSRQSSDETASDASEHSLKEGTGIPSWFLNGLNATEDEVATDGSARVVRYDNLPTFSQCSDETDASGDSLMEEEEMPAIPFPFSLYQFGGNLAHAIFFSALNSDESGRVIEVAMDGTGRFVPHGELRVFSDESPSDCHEDSSMEVTGLLTMFLNGLHSQDQDSGESIKLAMDELPVSNASEQSFAEVPANRFPVSLFPAVFLQDSEELDGPQIPAMFLNGLDSEEKFGQLIEVARDGTARFVQYDELPTSCAA